MHLPSSRRLVLAVAGTALAGLAALPASAGCADSVFGCGLDHDATTASPVSARVVVGLLPVQDSDLARQAYADLLPEGFALPAEPRVAVQVAAYDTGACARPQAAAAPCPPALPGWTEGAVSLRTVVDGVEGWFALSRPTTSEDEYAAARAAGLPAYLAAGSLVRQGTGLAGALSVDGQEALGVSWKPERTVLENAAFDLVAGRTGTYGVTPLLTGEDRHRTVRAVRPAVPAFDAVGGAPNSNLGIPGLTATAPTRRGSLTVRLDLDQARLDDDSPTQLPALPLAEGVTLADLVAPEHTVPGLAWEVEGLLLTQTDALDDGADGSLPAPPAAVSGIVAPPGAQTSGFATRVSTMTRGSSLTFANLDTTQHDVQSKDVGPDGQPLFHSAVIGQGTAVVEGAEELRAGQYRWNCSLHAGMVGDLVVH